MNLIRTLTVPGPIAAPVDKRRTRWGAVFIGAAVLGPALLAARFSPAPMNGGVRRFYRRLDKPEFTPPDPVFGGVWPPLYGLIAVSGLRIWNTRASPTRSWGLGLFSGSQALTALWMWAAFGQRRLGLATGIALGNVATVAAYTVTARRIDGPAALLAIPFLGWIGFAALLTEELARRNRSRSR